MRTIEVDASRFFRVHVQARSTRADKANVPGLLHQGVLSLFSDDPWLAFDLLGKERPVDGTPIDRRAEVERARGDEVTVRFPDLVLVHRDEHQRRRGAVICVEAQKEIDWLKRYRIPVYQALLADDHKLPTWVVVVSFSRAMSAALKGWGQGPPPRVEALVIDADTVPPPASLEQAKARPTAAVLAAALHGYRGNLEVARLGVRACGDLPKETRQYYTAIVLAALPPRGYETLKGELQMEENEEWLAIERQCGPFQFGLREGLEQGRRNTLIELIFTVLELRGVPVDADSATRIRAGDALETLEAWARRAREVARASELFVSRAGAAQGKSKSRVSASRTSEE